MYQEMNFASDWRFMGELSHPNGADFSAYCSALGYNPLPLASPAWLHASILSAHWAKEI